MGNSVTVDVLSKVRKYKVNKCALKNIIRTIFEELHVKERGYISIALLSKNAIRELNKKYRNKDKPTNVLSFQIDYKKGKDLYGEILISPEVAHEEAKKLGNNFNDYFIFLIIHGVLHLLGYDHEKEEEKVLMEEVEEKLLQVILQGEKRQVIELCLR
ncbi:rRNA maturation RNase YbeY [Caldisericum exile]|uniref:Endoribonuclease YbeY n=1 Tax=Caldisericum exile (strain DSM 21853 / NBRC 104410 / AZM16c01) TaxID=511051 RepID=A0A7U6GEJ7_CALEA|nr:rRNA maturation RNase YbeY [Caldisericum exile]BAL80948.1 putative metalloprotease [Caldisericum exile AZM16c01]